MTIVAATIFGRFPYFLSFSASGPSGLTPFGMLLGCLFCFISWVSSFLASRPEMLLFTLDGRRTVGMLGHLPALTRFLPGESHSRRVLAAVPVCPHHGLTYLVVYFVLSN